MSESGNASSDTEHPEPVENIEKWLDAEVQQVDYLLWSHGASDTLRARVTAEMRGERPPEWAVDPGCSVDTATDQQEANSNE